MKTNWRLQGWSYETTLNEHGREQRKLVYKGEYYTFDLDGKSLLHMKLAYLAMAAALVATYVAFSLIGAYGGQQFWAGACILVIIPLMYLGIGVGCLMSVQSKMTYRDYRGAFIRIRWASIAAAVLFAMGSTGQSVYVIRLASGGYDVPKDDLLWLAGAAFCMLDSIAIAILRHRFPARLIPPELQ